MTVGDTYRLESRHRLYLVSLASLIVGLSIAQGDPIRSVASLQVEADPSWLSYPPTPKYSAMQEIPFRFCCGRSGIWQS